MTEVSRTAPTFEEFVASRGRDLWRTAWLLTGDAHKAEDLVQTALMKCWRRWSSIADDGALEAYVRRTMVNTYTDWWRRRWNGERPTEVMPDVAHRDADWGDRQDTLAALASLPRGQRDVLARVVPEPPDSVADPGPVVRAARRQRRIATTVVSGGAVLAVVGTVFGVQALREDDGPDFVDRPAQIADPYATAPCPDPTQPLDNGEVPNLDGLVAVRYCTRPSDEGIQTNVGPADALVVDLDAFAEAVREIPDADPARCAAVSVVPTDSRALFRLADGTQVAVRSGSCDDVEVEGRVIDGDSLVQALFAALRAQRDDHDYSTTLPAPDVDWCGWHRGYSPAQPSSEHLVAATWCGPNSPTKGGVVLDEATVDRLDDAWRGAEPTDPDFLLECEDAGGSGEHILARTDRGDVVQLTDQGCDTLSFTGSLSLDFAIDDLG